MALSKRRKSRLKTRCFRWRITHFGVILQTCTKLYDTQKDRKMKSYHDVLHLFPAVTHQLRMLFEGSDPQFDYLLSSFCHYKPSIQCNTEESVGEQLPAGVASLRINPISSSCFAVKAECPVTVR